MLKSLFYTFCAMVATLAVIFTGADPTRMEMLVSRARVPLLIIGVAPLLFFAVLILMMVGCAISIPVVAAFAKLPRESLLRRAVLACKRLMEQKRPFWADVIIFFAEIAVMMLVTSSILTLPKIVLASIAMLLTHLLLSALFSRFGRHYAK